MDFERSDGVILNISDYKDGMQVIIIKPDAERGVTVSKSIFCLTDLATVLEDAESDSEATFHEKAVLVAGRIEPPADSNQSHDSGSLHERLLGSIVEPCFSDSGPKSTLIAHHMNSCHAFNLIGEVDQKRTSSLANISTFRNRAAVIRWKETRAKFAKTATNQVAQEIEAETTFKDSLCTEKSRTHMQSEAVRSLQNVRYVHIENRLKERGRTLRSVTESLLSATRMQQTHRDALRANWRKAAVDKRLFQREEMQQAKSRMMEIERKREINIEKRQEEWRTKQKQYVSGLRISKKQLERKRLILNENRQALAHDLFKSTLYYLNGLSRLYSILFILTRVS